MWPLTLRSLKWIRASNAEVIIIIVLILFVFHQHDRFKTTREQLRAAQEALKHPKTNTTSSEATIVRPTRIVTIIKEVPATGEKTTHIEETRMGEEVIIERNVVVEPVPVSELIGDNVLTERKNRWLVGVSNRGPQFKDLDHYGGWAGYSFHNRFDALMGITKHDRREFNILAVVRF